MPHFLVKEALLPGNHHAEVTTPIKDAKHISRHKPPSLFVRERGFSPDVVLILYFDNIPHNFCIPSGIAEVQCLPSGDTSFDCLNGIAGRQQRPTYFVERTTASSFMKLSDVPAHRGAGSTPLPLLVST